MDKNRQKHLYGWLRKQSGHGRRWIGISIAFAASSFFLSFFSFGGGALV